MHAYEGMVPVRVEEKLISALQHCPAACLPLLPNVTKLEWSEYSHAALQDSCISLLRHFTGPAVATVTLSLMRWPTWFSVELATLTDLPRLCPNVTSFSLALHSRDYEPSEEVGRMLAQWPKLRFLRTCAIAQPGMDELFSQGTLNSLYIDHHKSPPLYSGAIPDTVSELTLDVAGSTLCTRLLQNMYASPSKFHLLISTMDGQAEPDIEEMFHLLPRRLDTSRLLSLTIQPKARLFGIPIRHALELRKPLVSAIVEFGALRELDLDFLCTAQLSDADFASLAGSLTQLRRLQAGTANESITRPRPAASIRAVIEVLRCCKHLETLHIVFDGSIPPPGCSTVEDGKVALSEELVLQGWGVSNRRITELCVGYSPIGDATINALASCLKSIMPRLIQIERKDRDEEWGLVQDILELRSNGRYPSVGAVEM